MKGLLFFFLIVTTINNLFAQSYYEFTADANRLYQQKEYKKAAKLWDSAFGVHTGLSGDYYNAACTHSLAGNKSKAIEYLEAAIKTGWNDLEWMKKDSDLISLHNSKSWDQLLQNTQRLQTEYLEKLNTDLKNQLESLRMQDQVIRLLLPDAEKRFTRDSEEYKWFRSVLMPRNDDFVLQEIAKIIEQHGWVGIDEVGELANQTLWLVIQHAPIDTQKKFLPLLKESVDKGKSKAHYLAYLQDRILMREGKNQIYGTQSLWDNDLKKNVICPIEEPEQVNLLRKKVGLNTVEDYAKSSGFIYNQ